MFGLNPNPSGQTRPVTSVGFADGGRNDQLEALKSSRADFGVSDADAVSVLAEVDQALQGWRARAAANRINATEIDRFVDIFEPSLITNG